MGIESKLLEESITTHAAVNNSCVLKVTYIYPKTCYFTPRHWNTGLVSSRVSLASWGEGASIALVGNPSSDGVTIKIPYGVDV